jgi:glycolate oxidase
VKKTVSQEREAFHQQLGAVVGPENVLTEAQATASYQVDGFTPDGVVFATSTEQVSQVIRLANEFRIPIIPWGSGSKQEVGPCLSQSGTILCLKRMNQLIELDAGNFTAHVAAGMVNAELQKQLGEHRFFFPLDPVCMETSTLGGEIATNATGPLRLKYGAVRDLVLGVTVVTPTGDIIHTGGKTMKNVAGFDLCKMYIGSWGTLGIITEAVIRLFPLPEVSKSLLITASQENAFRLVGQLLESALELSAIELLDWTAGRYLGDHGAHLAEGKVLLLVNIDGDSAAVARREEAIKALAKTNQASEVVTLQGEEAAEVWNAYRRVHQALLDAVPSTAQGKASVPIGKAADMFRAIKEAGQRHHAEIGIRVYCGSGLLYPYVALEDDKLIFVIASLKQAASALGGFFIVEAAPLWARKKEGSLPQRSDATLMKRLKTAFDPNNILNPGRMFGGLY